MHKIFYSKFFAIPSDIIFSFDKKLTLFPIRAAILLGSLSKQTKFRSDRTISFGDKRRNHLVERRLVIYHQNKMRIYHLIPQKNMLSSLIPDCTLD